MTKHHPARASRVLPSGSHGLPLVAVVGRPNVGKSTIINVLHDRNVAKTGNEPAVTKAQQQVVLKSGIVLSDNPGIMWPKVEDEDSSLRLAFGGAIPDSAIDYEVVSLWGAGYLLQHYPSLLMARFKLKTLPESPHELLEEIGRRRGGLRAGGLIDLHKAAGALLHEFRSGSIGRISLELPSTEAPAATGGADEVTDEREDEPS